MYPSSESEQSTADDGGFDVRLVHLDGQAVLLVSGALDLCTKERLTSAIETASVPSSRVVIDLRNVDFLDAAAIGAIVRADDNLRADGGALSLRAPRPFVGKVLSIGALDNLVEAGPDSRRGPHAAEQPLADRPE